MRSSHPSDGTSQDVLIEQRAALVRRSTHSGSGGVTSPRAVQTPSSPSSPHNELVDALVEYAHVVYGPDCTYSRAGAQCGSKFGLLNPGTEF